MLGKPTRRLSSPLITALMAQGLGSIIAGGLIQLAWPGLWAMPIAVALIQGACASLVSYKLEAPPWWLAINAGFAPLVVAASTLAIAPGWYLGAFMTLLLVFWRTDRSRVPLYLTNRKTAEALLTLLPPGPCHVLDLGCGDGGVLGHLARGRPDCQFHGIEHAPLPWLWASLSNARLTNVHIRRDSLWRQHLGLFEFIYAFLSPVPMPRLWEKAADEMRADALLVSNSFAVPGIAPIQRVDVGDRRRTQLFVYRPGEGK